MEQGYTSLHPCSKKGYWPMCISPPCISYLYTALNAIPLTLYSIITCSSATLVTPPPFSVRRRYYKCKVSRYYKEPKTHSEVHFTKPIHIASDFERPKTHLALVHLTAHTPAKKGVWIILKLTNSFKILILSWILMSHRTMAGINWLQYNGSCCDSWGKYLETFKCLVNCAASIHILYLQSS